MSRTPDMSAIHHDSSADLNVVGSKLKNILEVHKILYSTQIKIFQEGFSVYLYNDILKSISTKL